MAEDVGYEGQVGGGVDFGDDDGVDVGALELERREIISQSSQCIDQCVGIVLWQSLRKMKSSVISTYVFWTVYL